MDHDYVNINKSHDHIYFACRYHDEINLPVDKIDIAP